MIDRTTTVVQMLTLSRNVQDRLWIAAMARQTLAPVTATMCRNMAELGYDGVLGNNYNSRFYNLSQLARRPSISLTWGYDPVRYRVNAADVTWRHLLGLATNTHHALGCLFCLRNGASSAVSWIEDPSLELRDYILTPSRVPDMVTPLAQQYNSDLLPRVLEVIHSFGSICMVQASMFGQEARAIPDMSPLLDQLVPLMNEADINIMHAFLNVSAAMRLICRSYVAALEARNANGSTAAEPVGNADVPVAQAADPSGSVPIAVAAAPEGVVMRSPRG